MNEKATNRKEGYYWVKTEHGNWHIALWNTSGKYYWKVCWHKFAMYDEDFLEIDENKIEKGKKVEIEV